MLRRSAYVCLLLFVCGTSARAEDRPNVVIFLADDAGWGDYGHSGNRQVSTPNIDSIANEGASLDRFFVCPVCSPTRAEFLTGRYHQRGGVRGVSVGQERLNPLEKTVADAFKIAGYETGAFGKWHNGSQWPYHPRARGFDEYFGYTAGHWGEYFDAPVEENGRMIRSNGYLVDVCTDRAIQFIDKHASRPFLCYIPFTTPHSPWSVPANDWDRFKNLELTQRATAGTQEVDDETRCVLAMIENQDRNVGRVLAKLNELKLRENTIVVYFSDNGPNTFRWNGGMKGRKGQTDEGGIRSVCYIRWPAKISAGHTVEQIAGAIDLLPTLTSLASIPRVGDKPLDGLDLSPLLLKQQVDWPDRMIFSTWGGKVSVRTQRYRLDDREQLFDMMSDPGQLSPITADDPTTASKLITAANDWRREMAEALLAATNQTSIPANPAVKANQPSGQIVDPRPFPVGYREFPITMLPARDGTPIGTVRRSSTAPNCSYFVNWTSKDDRITWLISVATSGRYRVEIDYTCPLADAGSMIELSFLDSQLTNRVEPGWDPPLYTNQDTLPRPSGESTMKDFHTLELGEIPLKSGEGHLILRAVEIPGKSVMDVRRVTLTLLEDDPKRDAVSE